MEGPILLSYKPRDFFEERILLVLMRQLRTPQSTAKRPYYQNMCGFDSIDTAHKYSHLFELTYRFTPFAQDNRPVKGRALDIRGKCPLQLAGYDISRMPIARILRGQLLGWSPHALKELVPNA